MKQHNSNNQKYWNSIVEEHFNSEFYNVESFLAGKSSLQHIELELLGNVNGSELLHLQCHFGLDTLSLARMGAQVTGIDYSDEAISIARELNTQLGLNANFIQCDVLDVCKHVKTTCDIIFTSYGVITWISELNKWAENIANLLKPGGRFVMVEFHPMVWMFDPENNNIKYSYFSDEAVTESIEGSYTGDNSATKNEITTWNHSIAGVISALLDNGLKLDFVKEYNYSPYPCFENTVKMDNNKYQIKGLENKVPMLFSLVMTKI